MDRPYFLDAVIVMAYKYFIKGILAQVLGAGVYGGFRVLGWGVGCVGGVVRGVAGGHK